MKIGIMSMQRITNYGSFLQAFALKKMIEELGNEVQFVDYHIGKCKILEKKSKMDFKDFLRSTILWKFLRKYVLHRPEPYVSNYEKLFFNAFEKLGVNKKKNYLPKLDTLVIGSDEVFNCLQDNPNVGYSLELFGYRNKANKLISYAASFGNTTLDRLSKYGVKTQISNLLSKFDAISVRDNNSGKIVSEITSVKPEYHLDPVLVGDFSEITVDNVDIKDYIIVYGYSNRFNQAEGEYIKNFAKKNGKKLISIGGKQDFCDIHIECSPFEVLAYFKHSESIITDTFHGSIFSIINHKPFVTFIRDTIDGKYGNREKLEDMLSRLELKDRIVENLKDMENIMKSSINYEKIDSIRKIEREKSIAYLRNQIIL